jgi:hypothetical protein
LSFEPQIYETFTACMKKTLSALFLSQGTVHQAEGRHKPVGNGERFFR